MEIDHLKPATEDKMEMVMMNMDNKLPDFYRDIVSYDPSHHDEFTTTNIITNTSAEVQPHFIENPPCSFMSLPNSTISFSRGNNNSIIQASLSNNPRWRGGSGGGEYLLSDDHCQHNKKNSMAAMREMIFRIAAMQPIHIDPESVKPPKRRNVKISKDPQSVAARHRRERISERIRILQRLVPGGTKMDTASMLDEAVHYVKFLKNQLQSLERSASVRSNNTVTARIGFPVPMSNGRYVNPVLGNHEPYHHPPPPDHSYHHQGLQHYGAA